jgi:hypothetical protein
MLLPLLVTLQLVVLHQVDGYDIALNPAHVVHLRETAEEAGHANRLLARGAHCVVGLSNGKIIAVRESCQEVRRLLER